MSPKSRVRISAQKEKAKPAADLEYDQSFLDKLRDTR
jgi:hypothetical protein